ncbi:hypothetical protein [Polaromonas sp. AER18D-145]|uniref:HAMP domain-containing protein n=1 Tax=Polaromonas sp. AER18D-145 TaxID=1977060 RepID=UPI000BBC281F|nr:hypothetical protein [Polaromonas sp. AER18D-145]
MRYEKDSNCEATLRSAALELLVSAVHRRALVGVLQAAVAASERAGMVLIDRNVTLLAARVEAGPVYQGELEQLARTFNRMAESLQLRGLSGLGSGDCKSACGGPAWLACV